MSKPVSFNELQAERVLELWHQFREEPMNQDEYDRFIEWLENRSKIVVDKSENQE